MAVITGLHLPGRRAAVAFALAATVGAGCATTHEANWSAKEATVASDDAKSVFEAAMAAGDALWLERADQNKLVGAIAKWEEAAALQKNADVCTKLGRAHYLLGDGFYAVADQLELRDAEYQKGLDWATEGPKLAAPEFAAAMAQGKKHAEAIVLAPKEAVPAMYWYASNLGKWANAKGFATRLKYKDDIKATMLHVKQFDDTYFFAGPWRYFGAFEAVTAGLAGGDLKKSEENFKKATEMAPNYLATRVLWAETLCTKQQNREQFKKLLDEVIAADPKLEADAVAENMLEQAKAKKLLARIDDEF